jgi:phosphate transport system permease protein
MDNSKSWESAGGAKRQQNPCKTITARIKRPGEAILVATISALALAVLALVLYLVGSILVAGIPTLSFSFLSTAPNPISGMIGVFPSLVNTLYIVVFSLALSVPVGVGGAIYLNEYAPNRVLVRVVEFAAETLAGIPSILYGIFGYVFFCILLDLKVSLLAGVLTLTIMVLPIIIRTAQEALKSVPNSYREGALGLGTTKWQMIRTLLLPCAFKGILAGIILAIGRMISESAALILVAGGSAMYMPKGSIFDQMGNAGSTLSVELYRYAYSRGDYQTAFGIAALLAIIVICLNLLTRFIASRLEQR